MTDLPVKVTLTVIGGEDFEKTIQMTSAVLTIGRKNTQFNLNDSKISSLHANIEIHGKEVFVVDQDSRNGTILNGEEVRKAKLKDLDIIEFGFTKVQVNIVENLQYFKNTNMEESKTVQKDISSLIDDELDRFSKWDLSSPSLSKQKDPDNPIPYGLEVRKGPDKGKKYIFPKQKIIIGRGKVDCLFRDEDVSRMHAMIEVDPVSNVIRISDLDSTNGIYVNGTPVKEATVKAGDTVQMGQTLFVIVKYKE
ncbi:MAG: FHA domain-containing protein [Bdellovibrionales bacterium]|nr:FHA domain-containing protein [Bdellovibrionales bacterium]